MKNATRYEVLKGFVVSNSNSVIISFFEKNGIEVEENRIFEADIFEEKPFIGKNITMEIAWNNADTQVKILKSDTGRFHQIFNYYVRGKF